MIMIDGSTVNSILVAAVIALEAWTLQQIYSLNGRVSNIEGHLGVKKRS